MPGSAFSSSAEAVLRSRSPLFFSSALVSALAGAVAGALFLAWAQASGALRRPPAITATASSVTSRLSMCVLLDAARYGARGRLSSAACRLCREHMICALPRASEMSAVRAVSGRAMVEGGDHALCRGCRGAGHEDPASHRARVEWGHHLGAGGGHLGSRSAQHAALARPLCGRRAGGPV